VAYAAESERGIFYLDAFETVVVDHLVAILLLGWVGVEEEVGLGPVLGVWADRVEGEGVGGEDAGVAGVELLWS
jgi:hypothetical protein